MTKKSKVHAERKKQNNINDIIDIKDIRSQYSDDSKDNNGADTENALLKEDITDSLNVDTETPSDVDKASKEEISVEEKLAELQERYLRLSAEFDNYRKRTLREKIELTKNAAENILLNIIPVMDDFERALKLMSTASDSIAMKNGIDLIYNKFSEFLKQNGIKEIESLNKNFDVDLHEAVTKVPVPDESLKGKVVDVVAKGYWLHDKVIRHSKVVIGE